MTSLCNSLSFPPIASTRQISNSKEVLPNYTKTIIYECYKPSDIEEVKEYIKFVLTHRLILPNETEDNTVNESLDSDLSFDNPPPSLSPKLRDYLKEVAEKRKRLENHLWFDSNFECGNLAKAVISKEGQYMLYVNADTNVPDMSQWFYFSTQNTRKFLTIKFMIMNITKFSADIKPIVFSETDYKTSHITWSSDGINNCILVEQSTVSSYGTRMILPFSKEKSIIFPSKCYSFSFSYTFKHNNDKVYFAFARPYPSMRLQRLFSRLESGLFQRSVTATCNYINSRPEIKIKTKELVYKHVQLCTTSGGIPVDCVTISGLESKGSNIVITARVHGCEIPGSFKIERIIKYLLSSDKTAINLRNSFTFLIIPMLNPDGVIIGNTRYSLEGDDLNRCWDYPSPTQQPSIYYLKNLLRSLVTTKGQEIKLYCDLHGHSKLYNSFIYACHDPCNATVTHLERTRLLFKTIGEKCGMFSHLQCNFKVKSDKINTGRVVVWKDLKAANSFTMETSMIGYSVDSTYKAFTELDYFELGEVFIKSLHEFFSNPFPYKFYDCNKGADVIPEKPKKSKVTARKEHISTEITSPHKTDTGSKKNETQAFNVQKNKELENTSEAQKNFQERHKVVKRTSRNGSLKKFVVILSKKTISSGDLVNLCELEKGQRIIKQKAMKLSTVNKNRSNCSLSHQVSIPTNRRPRKYVAWDTKRYLQKRILRYALNEHISIEKNYKAVKSSTAESSIVRFNIKPITEHILASGLALRSLQGSRVHNHSRNAQVKSQKKYSRVCAELSSTNEFLPSKRECPRSQRIRISNREIMRSEQYRNNISIKMIVTEAKESLNSENLSKTGTEFHIACKKKNTYRIN